MIKTEISTSFMKGKKAFAFSTDRGQFRCTSGISESKHNFYVVINTILCSSFICVLLDTDDITYAGGKLFVLF